MTEPAKELIRELAAACQPDPWIVVGLWALVLLGLTVVVVWLVDIIKGGR